MREKENIMLYHVFCRYANGDVVRVGADLADTPEEQEEVLRDWQEAAILGGVTDCEFWLVPYENQTANK